LIRDIPSTSIEAGNKISNLREIVAQEMVRRGVECKCIRCREIGHQIKIQNSKRKKQNYNSKLKMVKRKYQASGGTEYFISFESPDKKILYAFVRLRIPDFSLSQSSHAHPHSSASSFACFLPELHNAAIVRELHTYGHLVPIDKNTPGATQHIGLGKKMMAEAEKITQKLKIKKIAVISGIGVRKYYKKLGYRLEGTYMVKNI